MAPHSRNSSGAVVRRMGSALVLVATAGMAQSTTGIWAPLPKRPYGMPVELNAIGDYLKVTSTSTKGIVATQIRALPGLEPRAEVDLSRCAFAGRFSLCADTLSEAGLRSRRSDFGILDALEGGSIQAITELAEAIDSAKQETKLSKEALPVFATGTEPGVVVGDEQPPSVVIGEKGVAVLALSFPGKVLVFRTRKKVQENGDTTRIWKYAGSLCASGSASSADSTCPLRPGAGFRVDRILRGVVHAREIREGFCPLGWQSRDYGASWERSVVIDEAVEGQQDSALVAVVQTCASDQGGISIGQSLALTRDGSVHWAELSPSIRGVFEMRSGALLNHQLDRDAYWIRASWDFGEHWQTEKMGTWDRSMSSAAWTLADDILVARNDGSALRTSRTNFPHGDDIWLSIHQRTVRKVRLRGAEVFVLQGEALADRKLLRLRRGMWSVVYPKIQDFEVVDGKVFVLLTREGEVRSPPPTDSLVYAFRRRVLASENLVDWDSVFTRHDSLYNVSELQSIDRIDLLKDGGLQLKFHAYDNNDAGRRLEFVLQSKTQGKWWKLANPSADTVPQVDSAHFRVDANEQLWGRDLPEDVRIHPRKASVGWALEGHTLKIRLAEPAVLRLGLVSPTGRQDILMESRRYPSGEHAIALPRRPGLWLARVEAQGRTEVFPLPPW